jgi:hypothetical protein
MTKNVFLLLFTLGAIGGAVLAWLHNQFKLPPAQAQLPGSSSP